MYNTVLDSVTIIKFQSSFSSLSNIFQALRTSSSAENLSTNTMTLVEGQRGSLNRVVQHQVGYLGTILDVSKTSLSKKDPEAQMVDRLEEAQVSLH